MATVYVSEQGASVEQEAECLVVRLRGMRLLRLPVHRVDRVLIFGNVQVTTPALGMLAAHSVPLSFLSWRGRLKARVLPPESKNLPLRMAQYQRLLDDSFRIPVAQSIIETKMRSQRAILLRWCRNHPDSPVRAAADELRRLVRCTRTKMTVPELMGLEGVAARRYFSVLSQMVPAEFAFAGRSRQPPGDPANALLGLAYTLVGNELASALESVGLDPYAGYVHSLKYGRPALALDLLEEFRAPVADRLVLRVLNMRMLGSEDFEHTAKGVIMRAPALKRFLAAYEKMVARLFCDPRTNRSTSYRRLFVSQSQAFARHVRGEAAYHPHASHHI